MRYVNEKLKRTNRTDKENEHCVENFFFESNQQIKFRLRNRVAIINTLLTIIGITSRRENKNAKTSTEDCTYPIV